MLKGWLIVNSFLNTGKYSVLSDMFVEAAKINEVHLSVKTGAEVLLYMAEHKYSVKEKAEVDFCIFWDKDIKLAAELEAEGIPVFNSSKAIAYCDDKSLTYLELVHENIPMPLTVCSPLKYFDDGQIDESYLLGAANLLGYPLVIKECFGSFGQQVYLVSDWDELCDKVKMIAERPYILQKYIAKASGHDKRLQVVGDKVVAAMGRHNDHDFRANISNGGYMEACEVTKEEEALAIKTCKILGLDFAGVDILEGDESPLICEVNSNAHFKNLYDFTGVNVAEIIIRYIKEKLGK